MSNLYELQKESRDLSLLYHGNHITFYIPGMFTYFGEHGLYPSVSITGAHCELQCNHCKGTLLESMIPALTPEDLLRVGRDLSREGAEGILLSGGCSYKGELPWADFIPAIRYIKDHTSLLISVHTGLLTPDTAEELSKAGVDQALTDIIGDDETYQQVFHIRDGVEKLKITLESLKKSKISLVPHIVIGIHYGQILGEYKALALLKDIPIHSLVFVSLMPLSGTPMKSTKLPSAQDIASIICLARILYPKTVMSLGCARERGNHQIDLQALECGINRIAIPSEETVERAKELGMKIEWKKTCCSVGSNLANTRTNHRGEL